MEGVKVLVGNDAAYGGRPTGVCSTGPLALATLNNVDLETHSNNGHSNAVMIIFESSMVITNSKLTSHASNAGGSTHVLDCCENGPMTGYTKVSNSTITGICLTDDCYNQGFWVENCQSSTLRDSVITMIGGTGNAISASNELNVFNSQIYVPDTGYTFMDWYNQLTAKFANNLISGDLTNILGASEVKLFNNFDKNLNGIVNQ
jgi:hypothetical protein